MTDQNSKTVASVASEAVRRSPAARFPPDVPHGQGRLNLNEPAFAPSRKVLDAIRQNIAAVGRYPDATWGLLRGALGKKLRVADSEILCGNGSDELLNLAGQAFLEAGTSLICPVPSFARYQIMSHCAGANLVGIPVRADGACDVQAMLAACDKSTRIMIVATPNNPTGAMLTNDELTQLAHDTPADTVLIIDEAYFEFAKQANGIDALKIMQSRAGHWLVLRTFSKAYALAGLRVGYGVASSVGLIEAIDRVRTTFNVNALAQIAALAALDDEDHMLEQVALCAQTRDSLAQALKSLGMTCLPSAGNFLAVDTGRPAPAVVDHLANQSLFVGAIGPTHPTYIRITIGSRQDSDNILSALSTLPAN